MAIPFVKHDFIGKSKQAEPYTAAAHLRYISRLSATNYFYAERMPLNYHAAQRFLMEREDTIRKNGRVIDKFTIGIPREMTMEQAVGTIRKFGFQISQGRTPFYFTVQNWNSHNPHCHFVFIDACCETGARVFKTTDKDSTERIKALWQDVCNGELEALGIDARIDFQDAAQKKAERLQAENDNQVEPSQPGQEAADPTIDAQKLDDHSEVILGMVPRDAPLNELETVPAQEESADDSDAEDAPEGGDEMLTRADKFAQARMQAREIRELNITRKEQQRLRNEYSYWRAEAESAREKAIAAHEARTAAYERTKTAEENYKATHFMGFRKGINLNLGPFRIRTAGIDKAMKAEAEYMNASYTEGLKSATLRETHYAADKATLKVMELEKKITGIEDTIARHERVFGVEQDFAGAEGYFKEQLQNALKGLSPNDVMDAYENGEITIEDAKDILHHMGHEDLVNWIEAQQEDLRH